MGEDRYPAGHELLCGIHKRSGRWGPFSLLINQPVPYNFRQQVANSLADTPNLARLCPDGSFYHY